MIDLYKVEKKDGVGHRIYPFDFVVFPSNNELAYGIVLLGKDDGIIIAHVSVVGETGTFFKLTDLKNVFSVYSQVINNPHMLQARMRIIDNWSELCKTF